MNLEHGCTVWFTGLSGAGKSTVSNIIEAELRARESARGSAGRRCDPHAFVEGPGLQQSRSGYQHPPHRLGVRGALAQRRRRDRRGHLALSRNPRRSARQGGALCGSVHGMPRSRAGRARCEGPLQEGAGRRDQELHRRRRSVRAAAQSRSGLPHRRARNARSRARPKSSASWKNWATSRRM